MRIFSFFFNFFFFVYSLCILLAFHCISCIQFRKRELDLDFTIKWPIKRPTKHFRMALLFTQARPFEMVESTMAPMVTMTTISAKTINKQTKKQNVWKKTTLPSTQKCGCVSKMYLCLYRGGMRKNWFLVHTECIFMLSQESGELWYHSLVYKKKKKKNNK